jgi:hypothetical protein
LPYFYTLTTGCSHFITGICTLQAIRKTSEKLSLVRLLFHCTESLLQPDEDIPESLSGIVSSSIDCTLPSGLWPPDTFPVTAFKSHYFSA